MNIARRITRWGLFLRRLQREIGYDDCMGMAAQIAYFNMLGLFPFLLFLISLLSYLPVLAPEQVLANLSEALPAEVFDMIKDTVQSVLGERQDSILGFGLIAALWSGSMGVGALITTINRAYNIRPRRNIVYQKFLSIVLTLVISLIMLASATIVLAGPRITQAAIEWTGLASNSAALWTSLRLLIVLLLTSGAVSILYFVAPEARQKFVWILPGTISTTILWFLGCSLFRLFVRNFGSYNATYGSIATVIVLMIWLWLSGFLFLLGAEINAMMRRSDHYVDLPRQRGRIRHMTHPREE